MRRRSFGGAGAGVHGAAAERSPISRHGTHPGEANASPIPLRIRRLPLGLATLFAAAALASPARAATAHLVQPGETLSGIAAANGLTTDSVAAYNGLAADHLVIEGSTILVPSTEEGGASATAGTGVGTTHAVAPGETLSGIAAASGLSLAELAAANGIAETTLVISGQTLQIPAPSGSTAVTAAPATQAGGLAPIYSPSGTVYLDAVAAERWNAMRDQSLADYGQDLYPAGLLSGYRTTDQQGDMYELFLSGAGSPANPPGTSTHELGLSVDLATPEMRYVVDQIGWQYGWGKLEAPGEWWHVTYGG